jgi:cytochrome c biogenesis protein CcdA
VIFAFAAGLLSTVNPCGFAMLPAYLSFFVGLQEDEAPSRRVLVGRALKTGGIVSAGFLAVFGLVGLIVAVSTEAFRGVVADGLSWVALLTGVAVVALGVWLLLGNTIKISVPNFRTNTRAQGAGSLLAFGISYGLASLSCAFPVFAGVIVTSFGRGLGDGIISAVAYAAGMAAVVLVLTLALALGKDSVVHRLRQASRRFNQIAGLVLVMAGAFIVFYWSLILSSGDNALTGNPLTVWVEEAQSQLVDWIGLIPAGIWIVILGIPLVGAFIYATRDPAEQREPSPS